MNQDLKTKNNEELLLVIRMNVEQLKGLKPEDSQVFSLLSEINESRKILMARSFQMVEYQQSGVYQQPLAFLDEAGIHPDIHNELLKMGVK